jgi:MerR family transcriptional regulator/heat shock protein HspR
MASIEISSVEPIYTLGVASRLSKTPQHSIRQYISKGLIIPFKTETKRHLFSEVDILRLQCIRNYLDEKGLNIAGIKALFSLIPCWEIKHCSEADRMDCDAYHSADNPCWEASQKGSHCKNTDCRTCNVYMVPGHCKDLKSLLKQYM